MSDNRRTKVLFLIESLAGGGAEKVLVTMLKHLDAALFDVTLCCVTDLGIYQDEIKPFVRYMAILPDPNKQKGLTLLRYKILYKAIYSWLSPRWIYRLFIPKGNDVEVAFLEGNVTRILSGSTNGKARRIAWVHTDLKKNHWTGEMHRNKVSESAIYNAFDQIVTVSKASEEVFHQEFPDVRTPVRTVYNPIDRDEIIRLSLEEADMPKKDERTVRLISVGRLAYQKAFDRLIRIIRRLADDHFKIELWILGDGPLHYALKCEIEELGLADCVRLLGFQDNPYRFYPLCDIFVCSSVAEGYSTAATEAIILGLPVVTTECSGMMELFGGRDCGIITENTEDGLYFGLRKMLEDKDLLESCRRAARLRSQDFELEKQMRPVEDLLQE